MKSTYLNKIMVKNQRANMYEWIELRKMLKKHTYLIKINYIFYLKGRDIYFTHIPECSAYTFKEERLNVISIARDAKPIGNKLIDIPIKEIPIKLSHNSLWNRLCSNHFNNTRDILYGY